MTRFRMLLLAGAMAAGVTSLTSRAAYAQVPVFDLSSFGQLVTEAQQGAQEIAQLESQLRQLENINSISQNQLTQLTNFYQSFAHLTSVTQLVPLLQQQSTVNPLPEMAAIENQLRGVGFTGSLASQSQTMLAKNQIYAPSGTDFNATQMNKSAQATAGQMAAAEQLYIASTQRMQAMQQLEQQLAISADPKQTADLTARATMESGIAQAQTNQGLALQVLQSGQTATQGQQMDQAWRQGADSLASDAKTAAAASAPSS